MISLDIREEDLENEELRTQIINQALYIQLGLESFSKANLLKIRLQRYAGANDISNIHKPLCDDATDTFIGDLPDITTRKKTEAERKRIAFFRQKLYENDFEKSIFGVAKDSSRFGTGFLLEYHNVGDKFTSFKYLDPVYTNVVYDCSVAQKPIFAFNITTINKVGDDAKGFIKYRVYIYTKKNIYAYETSFRQGFTTLSDFAVSPYYCFYISFYNVQLSKNDYRFDYVIEHEYSDIPLIEFPNNKERVSDTECVSDLIAIYSRLLTTRVDNVHDLVNYVLMLKNVRVGNEEDSKDVINMLKNNRILPLEGENVDAKFLSNPLNQNEIETLAKSIKDNIHYVCRIPDLSSVDFSQNASDTIIKIKTKPLLDLCKEKEMWFTSPYIKALELALNFSRNADIDFDKYDFDIAKITLNYSHTLPSNDTDATNMLVNLANSGMANPRELLSNIKAIGNVDDYIVGMKEWNDYVDKRKKEQENNNKGTNATNLDRQNAKPISRDRYDNSKNATIGDSNKISDNKVE